MTLGSSLGGSFRRRIQLNSPISQPLTRPLAYFSWYHR